MREAPFEALRGRRLLIVEDEYTIAADLAHALADRGADVVGPVGSVADALALIAAEERLDGAVLDLNLRNDRVYAVADALVARGVPFVFATGYGREVIPDAYAQVPRCEKPVETSALAKQLALRMRR